MTITDWYWILLIIGVTLGMVLLHRVGGFDMYKKKSTQQSHDEGKN